MCLFKGVSYQYNCSIPLFYISLINLSLSVVSIFRNELDIVKAISSIRDPYAAARISYIFNGGSAIFSITTVFGIIKSSRRLIFVLFVWDCWRWLLIIWAVFGCKSKTEFLYCALFVGWLVLCILAEMSFLTYIRNHQFDTHTSNVCEDFGIRNTQARLNAIRPPRYENPPPYSSIDSAPSSLVRPNQSATSFVTTEKRSARAVSSLEIPPPSYESLPRNEILFLDLWTRNDSHSCTQPPNM